MNLDPTFRRFLQTAVDLKVIDAADLFAMDPSEPVEAAESILEAVFNCRCDEAGIERHATLCRLYDAWLAANPAYNDDEGGIAPMHGEHRADAFRTRR